MNKKDLNQDTIRLAEALEIAMNRLKDSGFSQEAFMLSQIFPEIDKGIPFYEDVQKENLKLMSESKPTKMACEMHHLWREPKVTVDLFMLRKYGAGFKNSI